MKSTTTAVAVMTNMASLDPEQLHGRQLPAVRCSGVDSCTPPAEGERIWTLASRRNICASLAVPSVTVPVACVTLYRRVERSIYEYVYGAVALTPRAAAARGRGAAAADSDRTAARPRGAKLSTGMFVKEVEEVNTRNPDQCLWPDS